MYFMPHVCYILIIFYTRWSLYGVHSQAHIYRYDKDLSIIVMIKLVVRMKMSLFCMEAQVAQQTP